MTFSFKVMKFQILKLTILEILAFTFGKLSASTESKIYSLGSEEYAQFFQLFWETKVLSDNSKKEH